MRPLAHRAPLWLVFVMILIRFPNEDAKDRALELLLGEHPLKSWQSGELLVAEEALPLPARKNVPFVFEGLEAYERVSTVNPSRPAFASSKSGSPAMTSAFCTSRG